MVTAWMHEWDPERGAAELDIKRLNAQRGGEGLMILGALTRARGWRHHPAVRMWHGHVRAFCEYEMIMCREWRQRGYSDGCLPIYLRTWYALPGPTVWPPWWGSHAIHERHREWLVSRLPDHYQALWPDVPYSPVENPLVWPADPTEGMDVDKLVMTAGTLSQALMALGADRHEDGMFVLTDAVPDLAFDDAEVTIEQDLGYIRNGEIRWVFQDLRVLGVGTLVSERMEA